MQQLRKYRRIAILLVLALLLPGISATRQAYAATINVTTLADNLDVNGDCSLREAIQAANTDSAVDACPAGSGADTIQLSAGTYTLSITNTNGLDEDFNQTGDLDILGSLTIKGHDANTTNITTTVALDRVMQIRPGASVTLDGFLISDGDSSQDGGAIYNSGTLTLNGVTLRKNIAGDNGGGIFNDAGTVIVNESTLDRNEAHHGGGIFNRGGTVTLNTCVVNNNATISGGDGGGIYNTATLIVNSCWIHDNQPVSGDGAGIYNAHTAIITDSTIADNYANLNGGNIYNGGGASISLAITNSEVTHGYAGANGGGIYNDGALSLTNATVTTNRANLGDGIYNIAASPVVSLTNTTVVSNTVSPVGLGEGIHNDSSAPITLKNTLVAFNGTQGDCSGPIASAGHNLEYNLAPNGNTCSLAATGDLTGTNPLLGPFQNNGGKTASYALLPGSPAINGGTNAGCPAVDQRGMSRPHGPSCDIGAYEANDAPGASADSYMTDEDAPLIVATPGVLSNDSDPDNDVITATLVAAPAHGALTLSPSGAFTYTPNTNYHGPDSFSYRVGDGGLISASAPVTLTVISVNDPPVAADDKASTSIDTALTIPAAILLSNDTDIEGDALSISDVRGNSARGGRVMLAGGNVVYTPPVHFSGIDSLIYTLSDGNGGTASGTVTITVGMRLLYLPDMRR